MHDWLFGRMPGLSQLVSDAAAEVLRRVAFVLISVLYFTQVMLSHQICVGRLAVQLNASRAKVS